MEVKKQEKPGNLSPVRPTIKREADDGKSSRSGSKSEKELKLPPEKAPSDDGAVRRERRASRCSESSKETLERQDSKSTSLASPKVSRKYFTNWKQACDKTKDKTKELLKRWRTLPEAESSEGHMEEAGHSKEEKHHGWSVHVWSK
ncbi:unnamed protein product, partial [Iphiclides podalirius]